jgi:hypothetical protein
MINRQVMRLLCGTLLMGCTTETVAEPTGFVTDTFTKVKVFKLEPKGQTSLSIYQNKISGNCYLLYTQRHRGSFTLVSCEDFGIDAKVSKETK